MVCTISSISLPERETGSSNDPESTIGDSSHMTPVAVFHGVSELSNSVPVDTGGDGSFSSSSVTISHVIVSTFVSDSATVFEETLPAPSTMIAIQSNAVSSVTGDDVSIVNPAVDFAVTR